MICNALGLEGNHDQQRDEPPQTTRNFITLWSGEAAARPKSRVATEREAGTKAPPITIEHAKLLARAKLFPVA